MNDIHIRREGRVGYITLTRPRALNALTFAMTVEIGEALARWRDDPDISLLLFDAEGERAFCAGGDIQEIYATARTGDFAFGQRFWATEYRMNAAIARYPKPVVILAQGIVMGGGVGIAGHASHRVLCDSSRVAMPECAIGLVPDVGGSDLLARAPGHLGEFLGLTGHRMKPGDAIRAGFADAYVPAADWPAMTARLLETADPGCLASFFQPAPPPDLAPDQDRIDDAFSAPDIATLAARLETSDWGHGILKILNRQSPLALACALSLIRAARREPGVEAALTREYRFTSRASRDGDLLEGIRAAVIDKDRTPVWRDDPDHVTAVEAEAMLAPLGKAELTFPE